MTEETPRTPQQKPKTSKKPWATLQHSKRSLVFSLARTNSPSIKVDEHSKFLSFLLPFGLEAETRIS
jgi:hypothetical protein